MLKRKLELEPQARKMIVFQVLITSKSIGAI